MHLFGSNSQISSAMATQDSSSQVTIALVANSSWYLLNFRLSLLYSLKRKGYNVVCVTPSDQYTQQLIDHGFNHYNWKLSRRSLNPFLELIAILSLSRIYLNLKPLIVHHFTIKPCIYGTLAAKVSRTYRVVNSITGLGHVFISQRRRGRLLRLALRPLYSFIFKARRSTVVFQNSEDKSMLIRLGIASESSSRLIRGSGVDINFFSPSRAYPVLSRSYTTIGFPSRLIREKGFIELFEAFNILSSKGLPVRLTIAGEIDHGNRSSFSRHELQSFISHPHITFLGHLADMRHFYNTVDMIVLPSWREGLSRALIESASMECPIITTDVPGCNDVVDHGITGLLVPKQSPQSIALAVELFLRNPSLAITCATSARTKVSTLFHTARVNENTIDQYERLINSPINR